MNQLFEGNLAAREQSRALFRYILTAEPVTRPMILNHLKLPPTTLTRALDRLYLAGLITEIGQAESTGGRPASLFQVVPQARLMMGLSIAGQMAYLMLIDLHHEPIASREIKLDSGIDSLTAPEQLTAAVVEVLTSVPDARGRLLGLGISGINCLSDSESLALQTMLRDLLACPITCVDGLTGAVMLLQKNDSKQVALLSVGQCLSLEQANTTVECSDSQTASAISGFLVLDELIEETPVLLPLAKLITIPAISRRFAAMRDNADLGFQDFLNALAQAKKKAMRLLDATADALALTIINTACISGAADFVLCGELPESVPAIVELVSEKMTRLSARSNSKISLIRHDYGAFLPAIGAAFLVLSQTLIRQTHIRDAEQSNRLP